MRSCWLFVFPKLSVPSGNDELELGVSFLLPWLLVVQYLHWTSVMRKAAAQGFAISGSLPAHSIVQRVKIVFACGACETNTAIAKRIGLAGMTVDKWRRCYQYYVLRRPA